MADNEERELAWPARHYPTVLRYSGLVIAFYETFINSGERPALLALAGSMMLGSLAAEAVRRDS